MDKHSTSIEGQTFESVEDAATYIARMRYDQVATFLNAFTLELYRQSHGDIERGRKKLAGLLSLCAGSCSIATSLMQDIWKLCEPYMKEES